MDFEGLKSRVDITEIIGEVVILKRAGAAWQGLCPFHGEKTPSFTVYPETKSWYCFGCGEGGSVIDFVMMNEKCSATEAYRLLDDGRDLSAGKPLPPKEVEPEIVPAWRLNADAILKRYEAYPKLVEAWQAYKPLSVEIIRAYRLGYGALPSKICRHNRLIVPQIIESKVDGFRGRRINGAGCEGHDDHKHWLTPFTNRAMLYNGAILFDGLGYDTGGVGTELRLGDTHFSCRAKSLLIVENPIDCLLLQEAWGDAFRVVATLGVSFMQPEWITAMSIAFDAGLIDKILIGYDKPKSQQEAGAGDKFEAMIAGVGLPVGKFVWPDDSRVKDFGEYFKGLKVEADVSLNETVEAVPSEGDSLFEAKVTAMGAGAGLWLPKPCAALPDGQLMAWVDVKLTGHAMIDKFTLETIWGWVKCESGDDSFRFVIDGRVTKAVATKLSSQLINDIKRLLERDDCIIVRSANRGATVPKIQPQLFAVATANNYDLA